MTKSFNILTLAFLIAATVACGTKGEKETAAYEPAHAAVMEDHTSENMTVKEFLSWCADGENKLVKEKSIADMNYKLAYFPAEVMASLELRSENYDLQKFQSTVQNYSEMSYFNFRLQATDGSGELLKHKLRSASQYERRVKYMAFQMDRDLCLVQGKVTVLPGLFHFERAFEAAPYASVMLAFDNKKFDKNNDFTIIYYDRLFDNGFVKFNYRNKQLINVPTITEL